ncbi:hypothetical protein HanRHA438_Chr12g0560351 [Helianthus annuus]|nr:hypothetical protein HanIR_Chr12g0592341 [Helianthus annuus]KAJ0726124.1 hypothetical protein HanPI659440_Chr12g0466701 [Helianthus annuus]KAJ0867193.1 hypothetical protein HanRHA438_Chr12g0560351 [Helianthus annuus]
MLRDETIFSLSGILSNCFLIDFTDFITFLRSREYLYLYELSALLKFGPSSIESYLLLKLTTYTKRPIVLCTSSAKSLNLFFRFLTSSSSCMSFSFSTNKIWIMELSSS